MTLNLTHETFFGSVARGDSVDVCAGSCTVCTWNRELMMAELPDSAPKVCVRAMSPQPPGACGVGVVVSVPPSYVCLCLAPLCRAKRGAKGRPL